MTSNAQIDLGSLSAVHFNSQFEDVSPQAEATRGFVSPQPHPTKKVLAYIPFDRINKMDVINAQHLVDHVNPVKKIDSVA